ncbi:MAG: benzoyl-CoA reductase subunit A, partial [Roseovarius sp.]|nr:benzoyl-CoA reductase subunit A [Roseovarius sp.]
MKTFVGIDLGSTTTKAVILDGNRAVLGRGITNSRSNYDRVAEVARTEAFITARFALLRREVEKVAGAEVLDRLLRAFRLEQNLYQLRRMHELIVEEIDRTVRPHLQGPARDAVATIVSRIVEEEEARFAETNPSARSDFFRDAAGSAYTRIAEEISDPAGANFDLLLGLYDKCIIRVENEPLELGFQVHINGAMNRLGDLPHVRAGVDAAVNAHFDERATVGTGYGRARLPFPKEQIRSEILCHGLGAW